MELLKDILKWAVYCGPLVFALSWVWIAFNFHRLVRTAEKAITTEVVRGWIK